MRAPFIVAPDDAYGLLQLTTFYRALAARIRDGELEGVVKALREAYRLTPRWRFIRRYHLERQLMVVELAWTAWRDGNDTIPRDG